MGKLKIYLVCFLMFSFFIDCAFSPKTEISDNNSEKKLDEILAKPERQLKNYKFIPGAGIASRVKKPPDFLMRYLRELDGRKYTSYKPGNREMKIIKKAFGELPSLHQKLINERVVGIYFINDFWGSGMADWLIDDKKQVYCFLTFNPNTLKMNMSEWLTYKEKTCFIADSKIYDIKIEAGILDAFLGILLHESTHVVDYVRNFTPFIEKSTKMLSQAKGEKIQKNAFVKGTWESIDIPEGQYDFISRINVSFYGFKKGPKISISGAMNTYKELKETPFVSLYGSMSWVEDLAEFAAFYHLTQKLKQPYIIKVLRNGNSICFYEPMLNEKVRKRFIFMEKFYK